jgi:hypothetical protein
MVTLDKNSMRDRLMKGVNDDKIHCPAQCRQSSQQNGTHHQNHQHNPSAKMNLTNLRYFDVRNAFQHLGSLTDAIAKAFFLPPPPQRTMLDVMNNFTIPSNQLYVDKQRKFVMGISFMTNVLNNLIVEQANLAAIGSGNVLPTALNGNMSRIFFIHIFIWGLYIIHINIKLKSNSD